MDYILPARLIEALKTDRERFLERSWDTTYVTCQAILFIASCLIASMFFKTMVSGISDQIVKRGHCGIVLVFFGAILLDFSEVGPKYLF